MGWCERKYATGVRLDSDKMGRISRRWPLPRVGMVVLATFVFVLHVDESAAQASIAGKGLQRCWSRPASFGDDANCSSKLDPNPQDCPDYYYLTPVDCLPGMQIEWDSEIPKVPQYDEDYETSATLVLSNEIQSRLVMAPCQNGKGFGNFTHSNIHGCVRNETGWWCTLIVPYNQPPIVEVSQQQCLNETTATYVFRFPKTTSSANALWNIYSHFVFFLQDESGTSMTKWHITNQLDRSVEPFQIELKSYIQYLMYAMAGGGCILSLIVIGLVYHFSTINPNKIIMAASPLMCYLICFGTIICYGSIVAYAYHTTDASCLARQWLLPYGFNFIVIPLALKTWRVARLFSGEMKSLVISNALLFKVFSAILILDTVVNLIWTLVPEFRLRARQVSVQFNTNVEFAVCKSDDIRAQRSFEGYMIATHSIALFVTAHVAYRVRMNFSQTPQWRKYDYFDESSSIALCLLNLLFIGLFVVSFQYVIEDNPNVVTLMRCLGIGWSAIFTLAMLFGPKFYMIIAENKGFKDGTTSASASGEESKTFVSSKDSKADNTVDDTSMDAYGENENMIQKA